MGFEELYSKSPSILNVLNEIRTYFKENPDAGFDKFSKKSKQILVGLK